MALRPPTQATPSLEQTHSGYEARIDSLGDLASQFLLRAVRHPVPIFWPCCDWYYTGKYSLDNFITSILRHMKLTDDVIFGALMFIQRLRFRTRKPIFKTHPAYKAFISAYILSAKEIARENGDRSSSFENYDEWAAATQGLFDGDTIQKMEHVTLTILQEDRNKGLQADTTFDGLLPRFCDIIVGDYEVKRQFPFYPQFLTTVRPVFIVHWPEAEDGDQKKRTKFKVLANFAGHNPLLKRSMPDIQTDKCGTEELTYKRSASARAPEITVRVGNIEIE